MRNEGQIQMTWGWKVRMGVGVEVGEIIWCGGRYYSANYKKIDW